MAQRVQLKRSSINGKRPEGRYLEPGELALNTNGSNSGLFFEANDGTIVKVGPTVITSDGNPPLLSNTLAEYSPGELWLDLSIADGPTLKVWDGSLWRGFFTLKFDNNDLVFDRSLFPEDDCGEQDLGSTSKRWGEIHGCEIFASNFRGGDVHGTNVNATAVNGTTVIATDVNSTNVTATDVNATDVNTSNITVTGITDVRDVTATSLTATNVNATNMTATTVNASDFRGGDVYANNLYTGDLHMKNDRGDWTAIEEEDFMSLRNNKTGKRYKIMMEEIKEG